MPQTAIEDFNEFTPQLGNDVYIADTAKVIGNVVLGDDCSVWPMATIRGDVHDIRIGNRTSVQDNSVLHCTHRSHFNPEGNALTIGNDVTIGHAAVLHGCTIGNNVLVGIQVVVMDGAVVPDNIVLGAGTLVPPNAKLEAGHLYLGSPAKKIRPLTDEEIARSAYGAQNYVRLKNSYLAQQG